MNSAIIVAAGSGTRFGSNVPKQFLEICGRAVIIHTLERFENCASIDQIFLVLSSDETEDFQKKLERYNFKKIVKIVAGGSTRAESVLNGLKAVGAENGDIIAVHDGARPLVSAEEIEWTIERASETGAACLTAKVTDTIKEVSGEQIIGTVERSKLRRALTPQCFKFEILQKAFAPENFDASATDECFLVEKAGFTVTFVDGSARNIKITMPEDFAVAEILLGHSQVKF